MENFFAKTEGSEKETAFLQWILDDSDELVQAKFKPMEISTGFPTKIVLTFSYY